MGILKETKKKYEAPLTERTRVEVEDGICAASKDPIQDQQLDVTIERQAEDEAFEVTGWD